MEYVGLNVLEGPNGVRNAYYVPYPPLNQGGFAITDKCEYPEVAFRLADLFYDHEFDNTKLFGEKGVAWRYAESDEKGLDGEQGVYVKLIPEASTEKNSVWSNQNWPRSLSAAQYNGWVETDPMLQKLYDAQVQGYDAYQHIEEVVPPLIFTRVQVKELSEIEGSINGYVNEMMTLFMIGSKDLDNEWDIYLEQLESLGLSRMMEICQESCDAKYK